MGEYKPEKCDDSTFVVGDRSARIASFCHSSTDAEDELTNKLLHFAAPDLRQVSMPVLNIGPGGGEEESRAKAGRQIRLILLLSLLYLLFAGFY